MAWWLLPLALAIGTLLGLLGGGGAILTVPVLTTLIGQDAHRATTGSLVIIGLASIVGVVPLLRQGRVRVADGLLFAALGVAGSLIGSRLSARAPEDLLMALFAGLLLAVATLMALKMRSPAPVGAGERGWTVRTLAATAVGLFTGFFGIGGGFVVVPALTLVVGLSMSQAVGTSLLVIAINSAVALAGRAAHGLDVDWTVIGPFAVATVLGTLLGGRLSSHFDQRRLRIGFIAMLVLVGLATAAQYLPKLVS
ncbi:sulfite exporter TauE/SafE family protein [Luteococcus sp.]|uniref:sulfite exporter TauE/SafE family protein n=1 Tax=Luteococcus sp. TaxID=1969402 RepID=UPI0037359620